MSMTSLLIGLAGLMGAAGVVLAAASAHAGSGVRLDSAGYMLLFHAPALMSGVIALDRGLLWRPFGMAALGGFVIGSTLFAGDVALRAFAGSRLFPMAAPTGGIILIVSWLALAAAAAVVQLRS
ncbi:MAG TPA: DUF423 domain-containing protein [Xanthobacteraceae bacterium]|nr:DUF423 domain-containing protein [Xanthobacteraceae bacterium]